jgi:hypothetical protein
MWWRGHSGGGGDFRFRQCDPLSRISQTSRSLFALTARHLGVRKGAELLAVAEHGTSVALQVETRRKRKEARLGEIVRMARGVPD